MIRLVCSVWSGALAAQVRVVSQIVEKFSLLM